MIVCDIIKFTYCFSYNCKNIVIVKNYKWFFLQLKKIVIVKNYKSLFPKIMIVKNYKRFCFCKENAIAYNDCYKMVKH